MANSENNTNNDSNNVRHVAIILDGNRRYARKHKLGLLMGHDYGAETVNKLLDWCKELNIKELTLYTLSTENLKRAEEEVNKLFDLFRKWFSKFKEDKRAHENKVKIRFVGDLSLIPEDCRKLAEELMQETKDYDDYIINFCIAYGGRLELIRAFNKLIKEKQGEITEHDVTNALWLSDEPDIVIRTGGVIRSSNFLPWQSIYSEWIYLDKLWPEFTKQDLINCIEEFKARKRNFGK